MIQWWFNEPTQLQRCFFESPVGRFLCQRKTPLYLQVKMHQNNQSRTKNKWHPSATNSMLQAHNWTSKLWFSLVMSHARPSKDDFVSSGKDGHHLWFLFNPLRTKRLRFCFFAVGQILSGWKMDWCWMHVQLDGVVVMVSANLDTLGQNLFQPTHQCRWWCDWYCSQVTQGHQAGPSWTGELTDDSQGVIRDLTGELTTGELTDDGHVFWVSVVHFWEESLIICARRSWWKEASRPALQIVAGCVKKQRWRPLHAAVGTVL